VPRIEFYRALQYCQGLMDGQGDHVCLTRTGETLEGTGRGLENVPFLASYRRLGQ